MSRTPSTRGNWRGLSSVGASVSTQVSLLPPPLCIETVAAPALAATRVNPPGIT